tara:strand:+ start:292 stop:417 length:126 start_codon:yes stop_codon:yes gene_type:complete
MYKIIDNTPQVGDEFCYTHQPHRPDQINLMAEFLLMPLTSH